MASGELPKRQLLLPLVAFVSILPQLVSSYLPDFGVLGPNNLCAKYPAVQFSVPNNSLPVPPPSQYSHGFYHVGSLGDGLYYVTEGVFQGLVLVGPRGIIAFDAPPSIGQNQANPNASIPYVDVVLSVPGVTPSTKIIAVVYSHAHADHIGAAKTIIDRFPSVDVVAHRDALKVLSEPPAGKDVYNLNGGPTPQPLPNVLFKTKRTVRAGKEAVHKAYLFATSSPHSDGDAIIYFPKQSVLMLVDVAFPGSSPFIIFALGQNLNNYLNTLDRILKDFTFKTFVGGHLNRLGTVDDVKLSRDYARDIYANTKKALTDPRTQAVFGTPQARNGFSAVHIYLDQSACLCGIYTLDPKTTPSGHSWIDLFADATINTVTHCWAMVMAARLEQGL